MRGPFPQKNLVPRTKFVEEFGPGGPFPWGDQNRRDEHLASANGSLTEPHGGSTFRVKIVSITVGGKCIACLQGDMDSTTWRNSSG